MAVEGGADYPKNTKALIRDYGAQAIHCCLKSWNELCPEHTITNTTEETHRKRWRFCGHDMTMLEEAGRCGEIAKIAFEVNEHLTAKALRKHPDSPAIVLNCLTWWNCEKEKVHGWINHIEVDIKEDRVTVFPEVIPATAHVCSFPLS